MQEVWTATGIFVLNRVFVRGIPRKVRGMQRNVCEAKCLCRGMFVKGIPRKVRVR